MSYVLWQQLNSKICLVGAITFLISQALGRFWNSKSALTPDSFSASCWASRPASRLTYRRLFHFVVEKNVQTLICVFLNVSAAAAIVVPEIDPTQRKRWVSAKGHRKQWNKEIQLHTVTFFCGVIFFVLFPGKLRLNYFIFKVIKNIQFNKRCLVPVVSLILAQLEVSYQLR